MPKKTFAGQEVLLFDSEKKCMMLRYNEVETPCVNWHQYGEIKKTIRKLDHSGGDEGLVSYYQKGQIEGSFVAVLLENHKDVDIVVIGHSIVHPSDSHMAYKAHGRTVAAIRLARALVTPKYAYTELSTMSEPGKKPVVFCRIKGDTRGKMEIRSPEFLPAIYRRLKKING